MKDYVVKVQGRRSTSTRILSLGAYAKGFKGASDIDFTSTGNDSVLKHNSSFNNCNMDRDRAPSTWRGIATWREFEQTDRDKQF